MTNTNNTYDPITMWDNFAKARYAVRLVHANVRRQWSQCTDDAEYVRLSDKHEARKWVVREVERYPLHPVIEAAVMASRPYDWQQLFLEWPHVSQGDRSKIAYTQNEVKGQKDIQTVTSVGKYLNRHFDLPDHIIRDLVSRHGSSARFQFVNTTAEMIYHLHRGPKSCMVWSTDHGIKCDDGVTRHPYEAYDPKFGWHMAVRVEGDMTMGRALCMTSPMDGVKYFVRSYLRPSNESSYSQTDDGMDTWLREQGYTKEGYWREGEKLAYHPARDNFLAPYIDGGERCVAVNERERWLEIDSNGLWICENTGGYATSNEEDENRFECACCGDNTDEDDGYWVERAEDVRVCESCFNHEYTYVYGRRGNQYHVHNDNAVYVDSQSEHYDEDYLADNEIVCLENGDYEHMEEAIEINGDWYTIDDERICRFEDTDEYGLTEDGWQCASSCNWYTDDCTKFTEFKGERYHDDYIPQEIADATADKRIDEDEGMPTMLTLDMLWNVHMIWDYSIAMDSVTISLTYTLDGKKLYAHRAYAIEVVNSQDRAGFNRMVREILCSDLMAQANEIANKYLETQGE
jgi:hypothetical protein